MKINYFVIPLVAVVAAGVGSYLTKLGMPWYEASNLPSITPSGGFIGLMWTVIYTLSTISLLLWFNQKRRPRNFWAVVWLFVINILLNVGWSYLFFVQHWITGAIGEMILLEATVIALIVMMWKDLKKSSVLLWLYAVWVAVATYIAYSFWIINR